MQVKIILCDDDEKTLKNIQRKIVEIAAKLNFSPITYLYNDGKRVMELICSNNESFDILLLDIDMPDLTGIQIAKKIREAESEIILIFVSAYEQYVFESIEYNPFRFIRKNRIDKELELALKAALALIESRNERMYIFKTDMGDVRLKHSDIMYFETESRKVVMHTKNGRNYSIRKPIRDLIVDFEEDDFLQVHRGCVVNVKYIAEFSNFDITLENDHKLFVSRRHIKDVRNSLLSYWRKKI